MDGCMLANKIKHDWNEGHTVENGRKWKTSSRSKLICCSLNGLFVLVQMEDVAHRVQGGWFIAIQLMFKPIFFALSLSLLLYFLEYHQSIKSDVVLCVVKVCFIIINERCVINWILFFSFAGSGTYQDAQKPQYASWTTSKCVKWSLNHKNTCRIKFHQFFFSSSSSFLFLFAVVNVFLHKRFAVFYDFRHYFFSLSLSFSCSFFLFHGLYEKY